ncbi:Activated RNA polymerase II transcriptional coactivator p15 [Apostichopus japonicus]|uniref:Activated RNA polymerase II transcriptional coactivator p15 n=1 Tax=Stichopus japonicus TaxID=307972 RepID=A0A2G8K5J7_STIJA|nr:Activated RNA polymerase II transcriptional coactivator p15 [Apostichopus japonicus]
MDSAWTSLKDTEGKTVYFNSETSEATYDQPLPSKPVQTVIKPHFNQSISPKPLNIKGHTQRKRHVSNDTDIRIPIGDDRFVTVNVFNGKLYIHVREFFYNQAGRMLPTSRGIALTPAQWSTLIEKLPLIEDALHRKEEAQAEASHGLPKRRGVTHLKLKLSDSVDSTGYDTAGSTNSVIE